MSLSELLPQALIIHADGTERGVLEEERHIQGECFLWHGPILMKKILCCLCFEELSRQKR